MTIQTIPGGLWLPSSAPFSNATPAFVGIGGLTAAASRTAFIFQVRRTGTLDWFEWRQHANTNNPDNGVRISFQDLDASGNPDNTEDQYSIITAGFGANTWIVPPSYMGAGGPGSGAKRAVTKGDWIACCLRFENFVASDSITISNVNLVARNAVNQALTSYIATSTNSGTSWSKTATGSIIIALKYDDGTYDYYDVPNFPYSNLNARVFGSASTPDERGLLFQVPFPCRLAGVWWRIDPDNDFDIVLYDAASSVVETIAVVHTNVDGQNSENGYWPFASGVNLTKNVNYRVVLKPSAGTIGSFDGDFNSSAIRAANPGGSTWKSTSRTDAGAWTDTDTNLPIMGLVFDGFDDGTSGGGGGEHSSVF